MKISDFQIFSFELPLKKTLKLKDCSYTSRKGLIVSLTDEKGNRSCGEVSPLEGFSRETLDDARKELLSLRRKVLGEVVLPGLENLNGGFENWLGNLSLAASVRFGFETAVLSLSANRSNVSLSNLINEKSLTAIRVNGLLSGDKGEVDARIQSLLKDGYSGFKLKVGGLSVDDAVSLTTDVLTGIGDTAALRLDGNRSWGIGEALEFMTRTDDLKIEYIEEPVRNLNQLRKLLSEKGCTVPVALDESLLEIRPIDLDPSYKIAAIIIKPTLLGLERAMQFARAAIQIGLACVVSSSFETSVGLSALASLAAAFARSETAMGLDTLDWFEKDLSEYPVRIENGKIDLSQSGQAAQHLTTSLLEEVTDG
jgi:O-succinylbenzoate synthase